MAITVLTRPEKTLTDGYLSKWNSSELPLRYKFESDLYPINKVDLPQTITNLVYNPAKQGTVVTLATSAYITLEFVTITGTNTELDDGNYQIKEIDGNDIILDVFTNEVSNTGTTLKFYRNYLGLVKVFAGAREGHPYNIDGSKPLQEIGTIEVDFTDDGTDNFGFANVKSFIKPDISADFDKDFENSHFGWTSFYLQLSETYDAVENGVLATFQSDFIDDEYDNCIPFDGYDNDSFDNGLTDWLQADSPSASDRPWTANVGSVSVDLTPTVANLPFSYVLYQNITLINNNTYQFDLDIVYTGTSASCDLRIMDTSFNLLGSLTITTSGVYTIFVTPNTDVTGVGVSVINNNLDNLDITLNTFVATYNGSSENLCLAINYANYGCKQFQDNLGGNFGDYVLNNTETTEPKMLTHFEELSYFYDKPFYVNGIIPTSTFSLSDNQDNLFVYVQLFDENNNSVLLFDYKVENFGDGVYTVDPNIKQELDNNNIGSCDWSYGIVRFVIVPMNLFPNANNGTFEGDNISGLTLLNTNPDEVGLTLSGSSVEARTGAWSGLLTTSKSSMTEISKIYKVLENDSLLNVTEGLAYEIKSFIYLDSFQFNQQDNASFYWIPKGYDESEVVISPLNITADNIDTWVETNTTFFAKTTEAFQLELRTDIQEDINVATGVTFYIDDITFKGPIDFISEGKTIKNTCDCSHYGVNLRWKNDLGGWENWYFNKESVFSENVTSKINIKRDITSNWDDTFINGETQNDTIKTTANKSILVRSQLLTKNQQEVLQQIRRSVRVQLLMDSGKWQTVTIPQSTFVINDQGDKTRDISFTIELPEIEIQEQ